MSKPQFTRVRIGSFIARAALREISMERSIRPHSDASSCSLRILDSRQIAKPDREAVLALSKGLVDARSSWPTQRCRFASEEREQRRDRTRQPQGWSR
jgi:hypothetical protein